MLAKALFALVSCCVVVAMSAWAVGAYNYAIYRWKHWRTVGASSLVWPLWLAHPDAVPSATANRRIVIRCTMISFGACLTAFVVGTVASVTHAHL